MRAEWVAVDKRYDEVSGGGGYTWLLLLVPV